MAQCSFSEVKLSKISFKNVFALVSDFTGRLFPEKQGVNLTNSKGVSETGYDYD